MAQFSVGFFANTVEISAAICCKGAEGLIVVAGLETIKPPSLNQMKELIEKWGELPVLASDKAEFSGKSGRDAMTRFFYYSAPVDLIEEIEVLKPEIQRYKEGQYQSISPLEGAALARQDLPPLFERLARKMADEKIKVGSEGQLKQLQSEIDNIDISEGPYKITSTRLAALAVAIGHVEECSTGYVDW